MTTEVSVFDEYYFPPAHYCLYEIFLQTPAGSVKSQNM
jgi:hypothetical protein